MSIYAYKARDASGKAVNGTMEAQTKTELIDKLHKMGYMTTYVAESNAGAGLKIDSFFERFKRINAEDMIMFYVQLANMINAGISILASLDALSNQIENKKFKEIIGSIKRSVEGGDSFSQAVSNYPKVFPRLFVNMIKAGEVSGKLDTVLIKYAEFFEHQEDLKEKVRGAMFYPLILLTVGIAVMLLIVTFVIPQFANIYMKSGVRLPTPTLIVYKLGIAIKSYWYILIGGFIAIILGIRYYLKTEKGAFFFDKLKLKLPIIGPLHRKVAISSFTRTLGTLIGSGVPILESLDIAKGVVQNEILSRIIESAKKAVERGERLAEPLQVSREFPADVVQMISTGEETGNLDMMLDKISNFYDRYVGYAIKKLTTAIEPIFLLIMGTLVGFIMASMLMPIFDMVKTLKQ